MVKAIFKPFCRGDGLKTGEKREFSDIDFILKKGKGL